jgi:hypothetical protein
VCVCVCVCVCVRVSLCVSVCEREHVRAEGILQLCRGVNDSLEWNSQDFFNSNSMNSICTYLLLSQSSSGRERKNTREMCSCVLDARRLSIVKEDFAVQFGGNIVYFLFTNHL